MRLAILGGGGFRVPLVYQALLSDTADRRVDEVVLYDVDADRVAAVDHVLRAMADEASGAVRVRTEPVLDDALAGADVVFSAMRVGGAAGRVADERVALDLGLLGQETTGAGGLAYGLRTVPVARHVAARIAAVCPQAWVVNFTNPVGMITEAMQAVLGDRVVGVCDTPVGLAAGAVRALGADPARTAMEYVGLNHLGWLRGLHVDGADVLPRLLADDAALARTEEGRLFGADWLRALGAIPNEYLYYYYFTREAVATLRAGGDTRGEFVARQQDAFYAAANARPADALATWRRARAERDATYMAENRESAGAGERSVDDIAAGGYEGVALALVAAVARNEPATLVLNVRNGSAVPGLPADAVVEVCCHVDANGPRPLATRPLPPASLGLVQQVKGVERLTIEAATSGSYATALAAFAQHPLVDSVAAARALLAGYTTRIPALAAVFTARP